MAKRTGWPRSMRRFWAGHAERVLGRPLAAANTTPAVVDVLLMMWLPEISMNDRDELIREIQLSLSGTDRTVRPETKAAQLDFIRRRNVTPNLRRRVRAAFLRAHKTSRSVPQSTGKLRAQHEFPRELVGLGSTPTVEPYPHQVQAWEKLDALAASRGDRRAGQLVLPTGSGKTFTSVRWLLPPTGRATGPRRTNLTTWCPSSWGVLPTVRRTSGPSRDPPRTPRTNSKAHCTICSAHTALPSPPPST